MSAAYTATVGLEVHVQLRTRTKIWCGCRNAYGSAPNTDVCPVCLGYPGAMPVLNRRAMELTVRAGLMLGCEINRYSKWDRKNYYYPDMPKNYQISQYDLPLCLGGSVPIVVDGVARNIRLTRIHLEEDVGKNTHYAGRSGVDFNRAGTPLMEIVTEPDIHTPDEALAFLHALKQTLAYGEISDCNLEEGNIRCDVNSSVAPAGADELGVKTEIKNMNTFKGVHRALGYEIKRQIKALGKGDTIVQETRRWDDDTGVTSSMRSKEYAHDYRYFPEPDLVPVQLTEEQIDSVRAELPELPHVRRQRFVEAFGLPDYDAEVLTAERALADYYEAAVGAGGEFKATANWVMGEVLRVLSEKGISLDEIRVSPEALAALVKMVDGGKINHSAAKQVFQVLADEGGDPAAIVEAKGLAQVSDTSSIEGFAEEAIAANPQSVADFKEGKEKALQHLMGQVMRLSKGKANPAMVMETLREKLK